MLPKFINTILPLQKQLSVLIRAWVCFPAWNHRPYVWYFIIWLWHF